MTTAGDDVRLPCLCCASALHEVPPASLLSHSVLLRELATCVSVALSAGLPRLTSQCVPRSSPTPGLTRYAGPFHADNPASGIRCDGQLPCQQCLNASLTCKRDHVPRKRGPKRGHGRVMCVALISFFHHPSAPWYLQSQDRLSDFDMAVRFNAPYSGLEDPCCSERR